MPASRIKQAQRIQVQDPDLDRVQANVHEALAAIVASPTLDSQQVTAPLANTVLEQVVVFPHTLGRVPTGLHVVNSTYLVTAVGKQSFTRTSAVVSVILSNPGPGGALTAVVF